MSQINWGIIGLGNIANEFAQAFKELSNGISHVSPLPVECWLTRHHRLSTAQTP